MHQVTHINESFHTYESCHTYEPRDTEKAGVEWESEDCLQTLKNTQKKNLKTEIMGTARCLMALVDEYTCI